MKSDFHLIIVGATGVVGTTFLKILEQERVIPTTLTLLASAKSKGKKINFDSKDYFVEELDIANFPLTADFVIMASSKEVSQLVVPIALARGMKVIDNSSAFRLVKDIPLCIPEITDKDVFKNNSLFTNPNCSVIGGAIPLYILSKLAKIKRIDLSTYQATSGSGQKGVDDLTLRLKKEEGTFYPCNITLSCLPLIDRPQLSLYTSEEEKVIFELKKILKEADLQVSATCVRVPIFVGHSSAISVKLEKEIDINQFKLELVKNDAILLKDNFLSEEVPLNELILNTGLVAIGRIRKDYFDPTIIHFFVCSDNLWRGAGYNGVMILKNLLEVSDV